jgi:poly(3-hydroxybutyrate) depolymerase
MLEHDIPFFENSQIYTLHEMQHAMLAPVRVMASASKHFFFNPLNPLAYTTIGRKIAAASELIERVTQDYDKPSFGITEVLVEGVPTPIHEEIVAQKLFCNLIHFKKESNVQQPRLLLVAPMSGHYATLLRGTVKDLLPFCDVYITDWLDARDIPVSEGDFNLHSYVDYVIDFFKFLGAETHVMAVCQPSVPVLAAVSVLNAYQDGDCPRSMTLIGGPIDTREAPTQVNMLAKEKPLEWFEQNVISRVPFNYPGFTRRVYPGFLQLTGFINMNRDKHIEAHKKLFHHLVEGDGEGAEAHRVFYNEYLSVMDITAEFYLQTIVEVFQKHSLPTHQFIYRDERVRPDAITRTALLTLEGELDDISGVGQTFATHKICPNLPAHMKQHHLQTGVGHYGIFNGRKFREFVVPVIVDFIRKHDKPLPSRAPISRAY